MKKLLLLLLVAIFAIPTMAQSDHDYIEIERTVLKTERKAAVADAMQFTDEEAKVFWPLYNEYTAKVYEAKTKSLNIILDYADSFETINDQQADDLILRSFKVEQELQKLKMSYYKKFKKILPAGRVARYYQIENKIEALIAAEIAFEIPLIEVGEK